MTPSDTAATSPVHPLLVHDVGRREFLTGNEAIVRGAIEAGVAFACGYPGTPSSEITDSFAQLAAPLGIPFEYSVNEKIALEMAFAASLAGARSICAMKHLGLTYAGDPLSTIPYIGTVAGMVIVSAGDPSCRTSPNEQDQRHFGPMMHLPVFDPSTPDEALQLTRFGFSFSEATRFPVLLRPTTRVCHTRASVEFGSRGESRVSGFTRDPDRFVPVPHNARRMRVEIRERLSTARRLLAEAGWMKRRGEGSLAILASGPPAATCADLLDELDLTDRVVLIRLPVVWPLLEDQLAKALADIEQVLVVEELSPFLEDAIAGIAHRQGLHLRVLGKRTGHLPEEFEYEPATILRGLESAFGVGPGAQVAATEPVPPRPPVLCAGCPHRSAYFAARAVFDDDQLWFNDIGCYTLGFDQPLETADALLCMGAGLSLAAGVSRVTGQRTVGFVGDSTFFHSGMPALLNAIKENVNMVAVVLDNDVTAMTGFQDSPGIQLDALKQPQRRVPIEDVVRALGARHVERVDPEDLPASIEAFRRAREHPNGVSVVIVERACPVYLKKVGGAEATPVTFRIDPEMCQQCGREQYGTRCSQCSTPTFGRQKAHNRALESGSPPRSLPAVAPCATACPLNLCIQGYSAHIASGQYQAALELIMDRLPLPDSVCRVCHRPCERICVRHHIDSPVAINDLKRFVMEQASTADHALYTYRCAADNGYHTAVVGAGPAGLAAAHELRMRGYRVTLFDAADQPGGLLRYGIPEYRLPRVALDRDIERILSMGVEFRGGMRLGVDQHLSGLVEHHDAVVLALGAQRPRRLEFNGQHVDGAPAVIDAIGWLRSAANGDRPDCGPHVLVVGGGNSAIDAARVARRSGAEVTLTCLESRNEMPAIADEVEEAVCEGVTIRCRTRVASLAPGAAMLGPVELDGSDGEFTPDRVREVGPADEPLATTTVLVAIGQEPDRDALGALAAELTWTDSRLTVDPVTLQTSHPKVFTGGDLAAFGTGPGTVTDAIAGGQRAAWGIDRQLRGIAVADGRVPPPRIVLDRRARATAIRRDRAERHMPPHLPAEHRQTFDEVVGPLTEEAARAEAARCMICGKCGNCRACLDTFGCPALLVAGGRIAIDAAQCAGCGVCADFCPSNAIVAEPTSTRGGTV